MMRSLAITTMIVAVLTVAARPASAQQADRAPSPAAALSLAIRELAVEADRARENGQLPRRRADFAKTYAHDVSPKMLATRITGPVDRDPFRDAYIRWQLTSFNPPLDDLSDAAFEKLVRKLPALLPNPRADRHLINQLQQAAGGAELTETDADRAREILDQLADRTAHARDLNIAAVGFRDWVVSRMPTNGPRPLQLRLERCAALLQAGWDVGREKSGIDEAFGNAARDRALDATHRAMLATQAGRLVNRDRLYIRSARVVESRLTLDLASTAVYDFDVRRWARLLKQPSAR